MSTTPRPTAAAILRYAADQQIDMVAEMLSETEQRETLHRIFAASEAGYLAATDEGMWRLTPQGADYLAARAA